MKFRALLLSFVFVLTSITPAGSATHSARIAIAYDIGFIGDGSFNDAVSKAFAIAKKKYGLVEPFVREVPTTGTPGDRLSRLRFLARSGYTLIIAVGADYRDAVRRVSMEFTETQFALINDARLSQLNIANIVFDEVQGAYLAGVIAAAQSRRKSVGFIGNQPELLAGFRRGVSSVSERVAIVKISDPSDPLALRNGLARIDVAYSTWDDDPTVLTTVLEQFPTKVQLILETPDQYFAELDIAQNIVVAKINKSLQKPINDLVRAALENTSFIDVIDEVNGIYGRRYGVKAGGITVSMGKIATVRTKMELSKAKKQLSKKSN